MSRFLLLVVLLLTPYALAQEEHDAVVDAKAVGVLHGVVLTKDGKTVEDISVSAVEDKTGPAALPIWKRHVRTNRAGEFRFEHVDFGRYLIFVHDERAGYVAFPASPRENSCCTVNAELAALHPESEALAYLPPRASFLGINVTDQRNGTPVSPVRIELTWAEDATSALYDMTFWKKPDVLIIPPERDLLLYVSSPGFRGWPDAVGKKIHLSSGARLSLDVQLTPLAQ